MSVSPDTSIMCDSKSDDNEIESQDSEHEYLDEMCLEPITSVHGCSRLCNACLGILQASASPVLSHMQGGSPEPSHMWLDHLRYWATLRSSAEGGCLLCSYLLDLWEGSGDEYRATALVRSQAMVSVQDHQVEFSCRMSESYVLFDLVNPALDPITCLNDQLKCSPSTSSPESEFLAGSWLQHCLKSHMRCRTDPDQSREIPARLIEIKHTDHAPTLRLIETGGQLREERHYMTLSYCWGDALFPTLRTDNKPRLKNGIAFETLPKAFQDTIHIAGWFQVEYLWIDSLCIIQDSHDDWVRESCKMKDIHRNSFLTVAATGATNPSMGCFRDRNPSLVEPIRYRASNEAEEYITIFEEIRLEKAIHSSPLSKRAWAFQERLLSPRVLHFGENQMLWECNELSACETCPGGIQPIQQELSAAKGQLMKLPKDFIPDVWMPIVTSYSMGALTKFSDKCVALSGIANEVQSLFGERYIAGLWRKTFESQMLWSVRIHYRNEPISTKSLHKRPTTYVAPSWSWLSVDGPVNLSPYGSMSYILLEIIDIEIELLNNNLFGTIKSGWIQARGWLSAGIWQHSKEAQPYNGRLQSILGHQCSPSNYLTLDTVVEPKEVVCLPVASERREYLVEGLIYGLVLAPTGAKRDEYRRIGTFSMGLARKNRPEAHRLFFQQKLKNGEWIDRPKTTFTIV